MVKKKKGANPPFFFPLSMYKLQFAYTTKNKLVAWVKYVLNDGPILSYFSE